MATGKDPGDRRARSKEEIMTTAGYDLDIFEAVLDEKFVCHVCKLGLRDPVQTFCGHRFCELCFQRLISGSEDTAKICPLCKDEDGIEEDSQLSRENSFPDKAISREMSKLNCKCFNPGCTWTGKCDQFHKHAKVCDYTSVHCRCGQMIPKIELLEHETSSCPLRVTSCQHCKLDVIFNELNVHNRLCSKRPLTCDMCGLSLPCDSLPVHQHPETGDCLYVKCKLGCDEKVERKMITEHNTKESNNHITFLLKELEGQRDKYRTDFSGIEARLKESEDRCAALAQQIPRLEDSNSSSTPKEDLEAGIPIRVLKLEERLVHFERANKICNNLFDVVHKESSKNADSLTSLQREEAEYKQTIENKIRELERNSLLKDMIIKEQNDKIELLQMSSFDGTLIWKISDFSKRLGDAKNGVAPSVCSPPLWTSRTGYKMCARLYLDGDGTGKGSHLSIYFQLLRGENDSVLSWPFMVDNVQFWVMDQNERRKEHFIDAFRPDPKHEACKQPKTNNNPAIGCPEFMALGLLTERARKYVLNDSMFIKIIVKEKKS